MSKKASARLLEENANLARLQYSNYDNYVSDGRGRDIRELAVWAAHLVDKGFIEGYHKIIAMPFRQTVENAARHEQLVTNVFKLERAIANVQNACKGKALTA